MQAMAVLIGWAAGLWLIGVGLMMAVRLSTCRRLFEVMSARLSASDWRVQFIEQGLRLVVGGALILASPASRFPWLPWTFGWMLVISSLLILVLPIRVHGAYGRWILSWLSPGVMRILSPVPGIAGIGLIYLLA